MALKTLSDSSGELITNEGPYDCYQGFLEAVRAQGEIHQLLLYPPEQEEKSARAKPSEYADAAVAGCCGRQTFS